MGIDSKQLSHEFIEVQKKPNFNIKSEIWDQTDCGYQNFSPTRKKNLTSKKHLAVPALSSHKHYPQLDCRSSYQWLNTRKKTDS